MTTAMSSSNGIQVDLTELIRLQTAARHLHLHSQKRTATTLTDDYASKLHGRGMDFSEFRMYQAGDDIRAIDWRVTARTGNTHVRIYQEEHERPVFILLDQSASMQFGTRVAFKSVIAARAAAMIAWASYLRHDRVGGIIAGCEQVHESKPYSGKQGVLRFFKAIVDAQADPRGDNFTASIQRLRRVAKPGSLVFVISDFNQFTPDTERHLSQLTRHCDVIALLPVDPLEAQAPSEGFYRFSDGTQQLSLNTYDKELVVAYQQQHQQRVDTISQFCRLHQMAFLPLYSDIPLEESLQRLLRRRGNHA